MKWLENFIYSVNGSRFKRWMVIILTFVALGATIMMLPTKLVLARMLPGKSANTFSIYVDAPTGSSIEETTKITTCVVDILKREDAVTDVEIFLGMGSPLDYAGLVKGSTLKQGENVAEIVINLTDKHARDEASFLMVQRLRPVIQSRCEIIKEGTNIKMIEQPSGPPTLASIVVEVTTDDMYTVRKVSHEVANILKETSGVVDVDIMQEEFYSRYELVADTEKISRSGISIEQLNKILYLAFEGMNIAVKNSKHSPDQIPIFLALSEDTKRVENLSQEALEAKISSLKLMNKMGMMVPVSELVHISEKKSFPAIFSKNLKRSTNVLCETDMVSQVYPLLEARETMREYFSKEYNITDEPGINTFMFDLHLVHKETKEKVLLRWDGEMKVTLDTFRDLGGAFIAALVMIFLLLVIYYKSFAIAGIILGGSFLSIIGVLIGHWAANLFTAETFFLTATSLIGFIALMGISSRNSLLLVDFTKSLIDNDGMEKREAIAVATATRATPIILTAVAIILGSALLASDPIFGGLGVALISGTVAAVAVSLIFVPVLMFNTKSI
ncbi:MAG TPA: efflux RND transporter permease subunit [Campylobacterales bacterium]|nr:efflux RND transporter permease subunit [Campylobacterales bacterium]